MEENSAANGSRRAKKASGGVLAARMSDAHASAQEAGAGIPRVSGTGFAPNASRMRNFGRLKSFSSRHRLPVMATKTRVAAAASKRSANKGRPQRSVDRNANARVDLFGDAERQAARRRQEEAQEEETKENAGDVAMPQQQPLPESVADWNEDPTASSTSPPAGKRARQPQRMRCLKLKCTAHPDLVMPYLYGDRKSRINAIMQETGCTIDYCPMSPDEEAQSPRSRAYIMNFLVSAENVANVSSVATPHSFAWLRSFALTRSCVSFANS